MPEQMPSAIDSERILLGSVLIGSLNCSALCAGLDQNDFETQDHQRIYAAIKKLHESGAGISYTTVFEIERNCSLSYLVSLSDGIPSFSSHDGFIRSVKSASIRRRLILGLQGRVQTILMGEDTSDALQSAQRLLESLNAENEPDLEFLTPAQIIEQAGGPDRYMQRRAIPGIESPWPKFNYFTHGLHPKELVIVAAGTSRGKTAWALNYAHHAASKGKGVAIYSMEMSREELNDRLICISGKVDTDKMRRPQNGDGRSVMQAISNLADLPLYICDRSAATLGSIENSLRRMKAKHQIDLVIVDYLHLMSSTGGKENRTQEVSELSRGLKLMASEFNIPIIAVAQLNRNPMSEKRKPVLSDLRESGSIEQDANLVIFLHSTQAYESGTPADWLPCEIIIAKQRNGRANLTISSLFRKDWGIFVESTESTES